MARVAYAVARQPRGACVSGHSLKLAALEIPQGNEAQHDQN
jgi:hypothetical protein